MVDINFVELVFKNGTDAEKGEILLALEKRDLELFGKHPSGKRLLNMNNPYVKRFVDAAQKSKKGFGGAK